MANMHGAIIQMPNEGHGDRTAESAHRMDASAIRRRALYARSMINHIVVSCGKWVKWSVVDAIVSICLDLDLAYETNIFARHCGIHPKHREKTGVDPMHAQDLALKISLEGYSEHLLGKPMVFEKAEPGPHASAQDLSLIHI